MNAKMPVLTKIA